MPLRILIVEDNNDAACALALLLKAGGHHVLVVQTAWEALQVVNSNSPQVCLIDIGLPDMDGNELVKRLHKLPQCAGAVFIAVTGYGQEQDRATSLAAGFKHYFVKPIDTLHLATLLAEISSRRSQ